MAAGSIRLVSALAGAALLLVLSGAADASTEAAADSVAQSKSKKESKDANRGESRQASDYQLQDLDEPAKPLHPVKPRTAEKQMRIDAVSWYMTGRLLQQRGELKRALESYKKGIAADPNAVEIYQMLVPLAFELDQTDDAVKWANRAVEIDPNDYETLRQLAVYMASQNKLPEALGFLEKAVQSTDLDRESAAYVELMRDLAILYFARGQIEKSADSYAVVFDALKNPNRYELDYRIRAQLLADPRTNYEQIGQVMLEAKRPDAALEAFQLAAKTGRGSAGNLSYNLARVYLQTDKPQQALDELQKYFDAQRQSKGREAYQLLADILKAMRQSDQLVRRLEELAEKDPHNTTLQYFLAEQYVAKDEFDKAREIYEKSLKKSPDPAGYVGLAAVYRKMKRPADLLNILGRALERAGVENIEQLETELKAITSDESLVEGLIAAGREQAQADPPKLDFEKGYLLAKLAEEAKKTDEAIEFYRFSLAHGGDRSPLVYRSLGELLLEAHRYDEAAKIYEQATNDRALTDQRPQFLFFLSQARELAGDTQGALAAIADARKMIPESPLLQYQEAWIHYHSHNYDEAIKQFEKVISAFPEQKEIVRRSQFSLSNIYVQQGDMRKGEEILEKVLEEDPNDPGVNNDLGYLYADQGKNLEKAEKMIRKALAADPENPAYLDSLGWVLFKLGKLDDAVPPLEKAVKSPNGGDATIWDHLGDVYHRLGKRDKAVEAWQAALTKSTEDARPDEKLVERLREKLKNHKSNNGALKPAAANSP